MIYLDNAATTPLDEKVLEIMTPYFTENFGNANSQHSFGRTAANAVMSARDKTAEIFGCEPQEVYFLSGATEAANTVIRGVCAKRKKGRLVISAIEHPSVLECAKDMEAFGFETVFVNPDSKGIVSAQSIEAAIGDGAVLCAVMSANNEVGTIQPVEEIGELCRDRGVFYYCDCVQSAGAFAFPAKFCDAFAVSAHKFYGPKGAGALYLKKGSYLPRLISGGAQERSFRGGTTNVAGVVGLAAALGFAAESRAELNRKIARLRDKFIYRALSEIAGVQFNGDRLKRLAGNANLSFGGCDGQNLMMYLDKNGVAVSTGSACAAGASSPSHVLQAMGFDSERVSSAVRFSFGKYNTEEDVHETITVLKRAVKRARGAARRQGVQI